MNIYKETKASILKLIGENYKKLNKNIESKITAEQPKNEGFGDISTNIVMIVSKGLNLEKSELAEFLTQELLKNKIYKKVNFIKPGFLNITFTNEYWLNFLKKIYGNQKKYGFSNIGKRKKINIEFVSANPTGPLHIGHLRGAIFGDVLSRLLSKNGFDVTKEYYINDLGVQVDNLAKTINHHIENSLHKMEKPLLEGMYKGIYLKKIADNYLENKTFDYKNFSRLKEFAVKSNLDLIKKDLKLIGINFNNYVSEKEIHETGQVKKTVNLLKENNDIYEGFLEKPIGKIDPDWSPSKQLLFKSTKYGDKSDRVILKNNGKYTYFASDIAYHYNKVLRGYDEIINIWGADHAGYIERVKASLKALGFKNTIFTVKLCQIVNLIDKKKIIKMSKRQGNFVLVSDVLKQIGKDALRIFMLIRKNDAHIDFDLEKCLKENNENPSFYIQYAYARISSLKKIAKERKVHLDKSKVEKKQNLLFPAEINIIRCLSLWPKTVESAVKFREPHRIVYYLIELSGKFHSYWSLGKIEKRYNILSKDNNELSQIRLLMLDVIQSVIKNGLDILSVKVKDRM